MKAAAAKAEADLKRSQDLFTKKMISESEFLAAQTANEVAKCKSLFEAEQLVKSRYKAWLADALPPWRGAAVVRRASIFCCAALTPDGWSVVSCSLPFALQSTFW